MDPSWVLKHHPTKTPNSKQNPDLGYCRRAICVCHTNLSVHAGPVHYFYLVKLLHPLSENDHMTIAGKSPIFNRILTSAHSWWIFYCHVSFREGNIQILSSMTWIPVKVTELKTFKKVTNGRTWIPNISSPILGHLGRDFVAKPPLFGVNSLSLRGVWLDEICQDLVLCAH